MIFTVIKCRRMAENGKIPTCKLHRRLGCCGRCIAGHPTVTHSRRLDKQLKSNSDWIKHFRFLPSDIHYLKALRASFFLIPFAPRPSAIHRTRATIRHGERYTAIWSGESEPSTWWISKATEIPRQSCATAEGRVEQPRVSTP